MTDFTQVPSQDIITNTAAELTKNGFTTLVVANKEEARKKALELLPKGAEVMTATSETLRTMGLEEHINDSGEFDAVKNKLSSMDRTTQNVAMQKIGAAPEYIIGSVHAITQDGKVLVASNSGSQLPGYIYGSPNVVWIVGGQKIVKDVDTGMKRIYEHVLPLESERAHKAYGVPGSNVSKLVILNKENNNKRINLILVNEAIGY